MNCSPNTALCQQTGLGLGDALCYETVAKLKPGLVESGQDMGCEAGAKSEKGHLQPPAGLVLLMRHVGILRHKSPG